MHGEERFCRVVASVSGEHAGKDGRGLLQNGQEVVEVWAFMVFIMNADRTQESVWRVAVLLTCALSDCRRVPGSPVKIYMSLQVLNWTLLYVLVFVYSRGMDALLYLVIAMMILS